MYELMPVAAVKSALPMIVKEKVSERARKPDGFTTVYISEGMRGLMKKYPGKSHNYLKERENFIKRHLAEYKLNPTERRKLALVAWAYHPN